MYFYCKSLCILIVVYVFLLFVYVCCVVLCIVCFVSFYVLLVCKCVLYYCHRVTTQLQFNKYIVYHVDFTQVDVPRLALLFVKGKLRKLGSQDHVGHP